MPEKFPVQEQVNDEQGSEHEARVVVHRDPLVAENTQIGCPTAPPSSAFRENEIEHKPGDQRRDECDQATDVDKRVNGYAFHKFTPEVSDRPVEYTGIPILRSMTDDVEGLRLFFQRVHAEE